MGAIATKGQSDCGISEIFLTIPTAGAHPDLLDEIIRNAGLPAERIILVRTSPSVRLPSCCTVIDDFGPPNIQRWWNVGIREAAAKAGAAVAVMNDDCRIGIGALASLFRALKSSRATISSPARPGESAGHFKGLSLPYHPVLQGSLWMLDLKAALRPDEDFVWWFGDNDIDIRARRDFRGVVTCEIEFEHLFSGEGTAESDWLTTAGQLDEKTYEAKYAQMLRWHRWALIDNRQRLSLVLQKLRTSHMRPR